MPPFLKVILSIIVAAVAAIMLWYELDHGAAHVGYVAIGLGAFMIFAVWLFPETRRRADDPK